MSKSAQPKKTNVKRQKKRIFRLLIIPVLVILSVALLTTLLITNSKKTNTSEKKNAAESYAPVKATDKKTNTMEAKLTTDKNKEIMASSWIQNGLLTIKVSGELPTLKQDEEYRLWVSNGEKKTYAGKLVRTTETKWKGLFRLGSNFYSYNSLLLERVNKNTPRNTPSDDIIARGELKKKSQ